MIIVIIIIIISFCASFPLLWSCFVWRRRQFQSQHFDIPLVLRAALSSHMRSLNANLPPPQVCRVLVLSPLCCLRFVLFWDVPNPPIWKEPPLHTTTPSFHDWICALISKSDLVSDCHENGECGLGSEVRAIHLQPPHWGISTTVAGQIQGALVFSLSGSTDI